MDNADLLTGFIAEEHDEIEWFKFWEQLIVSSVHQDFKTFPDLNHALEKINKRVVVLFDGVEELLRNTSGSESEKRAVSSLCQKVVSTLAVQFPRIGVIVFIRRDMARDAITVNFAQFEQTYMNFELKWSAPEALRLVVWLVNQANNGFTMNKSIWRSSPKKSLIDIF